MNQELINTLNKYGSSKEPFLFIISYNLEKFYIKPLKDLPKEVKFKIEDKNFTGSLKKTNLKKYPISFEEYKKKFDFVQEQIKAGNSYLLNLTSKTRIEIKYSFDEIYEKANARFKLKFFDNFICFSPERFIKIEDNKICTFPMKGTIDANIKDAKKKILSNEKEMAEHTMVVDLLRNDLGIVANKIRVEKFRYAEEINAGEKKLLQISSKITGELNSNWNENLGEILSSLLPAGSITGTPKRKTVEILNSIEKYDRDFYTGVFGIYDGKNLDSAVMIRFLEKEKNEIFYKSGGGITCDSDPLLEYNEMLDKIYLPL